MNDERPCLLLQMFFNCIVGKGSNFRFEKKNLSHYNNIIITTYKFCHRYNIAMNYYYLSMKLLSENMIHSKNEIIMVLEKNIVAFKMNQTIDFVLTLEK